jgi:hypothetical protein
MGSIFLKSGSFFGGIKGRGGVANAHMVEGNRLGALATDTHIGAFAAFHHIVHMVAHVVTNDRLLVFSLVSTIIVRAVAKNNLVVIGDMMV